GTNGIQAMDLVGRKLADGGAAAEGLLAEMAATVEAASAHEDMAQALAAALSKLKGTTRWMLDASELNDRFAGATPYLRAWGQTLGAHYLLKGALADPTEERLAVARFYIHQILPQMHAHAQAATAGAAPLYALDAEKLSA
ncbi:MAG: acyl-CoA dehydrogenase C-terminal domain-containing protein, partial [Pseudomonadota bacterium]